MNTDSTRNWNYNDGKVPRAHSHTSSVLTQTLGREGCEKATLAFMMLGAPEIPQCLSVKGKEWVCTGLSRLYLLLFPMWPFRKPLVSLSVCSSVSNRHHSSLFPYILTYPSSHLRASALAMLTLDSVRLK